MNFYSAHSSMATTSRHASEVASQIFQKQYLDKNNVLDTIYNKSNDELWIETWLQQNNIYKPLPSLKNINVPPNAMTIHQAKTNLNKCVEHLAKLNKIQSNLEENVASMSSKEWKEKTIEIGQVKDDFTKLMCKFDNPDVLKHLQVSLRNRKRKRLTSRKRKDRRVIENQDALEEKTRLHKEMDQWLDKKKEEVEKIKAEESMQKDADLVLAEVNKKKHDARSKLSLIGALVKLKAARETAAIQRGEKVSEEDRKIFNITTEKLVKIWETSLRVYLKEEQGLKCMLEKNHTEDSKQAKLAKDRKIVDEWKTVLFGQSHAIPSNHPTFWALTAAERDLETFIAIRKSWDTFLTPDDDETGSRIPLGWVLPEENSAHAWSEHLDLSSLF